MRHTISRIRRDDLNDVIALETELAKHLETLSPKPYTPKKFSKYINDLMTSLQDDFSRRNRVVHGFIAKKDGKAIGHLLYNIGYDIYDGLGRVVYVISLYVDEKYRNNGIAHGMLSELCKVAAEEGCKSIWLTVWERNPKAVAFYRNLGSRTMDGEARWVIFDTDELKRRAIPPRP